jgi:hypothetical protein
VAQTGAGCGGEGVSPTARTMERLRSEGWTTDKVEQRLPIPGRFVTRDMGGFADGIAWKRDSGILAWQATSGSNVAAHVTKVQDSVKLREWLLAGAQFQIWGWRLAGPRGARKTYQVRRVGFQLNGNGRLCDFELE